MPRQARLVLPGLAHLVAWRALHGTEPYADAEDRGRLVALLHEVAAAEGPALLAYALLPGELRLLVTPANAPALARFVQAVGRRYVSDYNRRKARAGTLWAGRFRSAPVQPGEWTLAALRFVDGAAAEARTSAGSRTGGAASPPVTHPPEYWALGNTPFERERRYGELVAEPLDASALARIHRSLQGGWVCGDDNYADGAQAYTERQTRPRPRGRPRKPSATPAD